MTFCSLDLTTSNDRLCGVSMACLTCSCSCRSLGRGCVALSVTWREILLPLRTMRLRAAPTAAALVYAPSPFLFRCFDFIMTVLAGGESRGCLPCVAANSVVTVSSHSACQRQRQRHRNHSVRALPSLHSSTAVTAAAGRRCAQHNAAVSVALVFKVAAAVAKRATTRHGAVGYRRLTKQYENSSSCHSLLNASQEYDSILTPRGDFFYHHLVDCNFPPLFASLADALCFVSGFVLPLPFIAITVIC